MPGPHGPWDEALVAAVRSGEVYEATIDEHLGRLLRLAERVGAFHQLRSYPVDLPAPDSALRKEQLKRLAARGMTVLTNRNGVLPLERTQRVALIGRHAIETVDMGGGSAQVNPPYQTSVADGLRSLVGNNVTMTDGVEVRSRAVPARSEHLGDMHFTLLAADGAVVDERLGPQTTTLVGFDDGLAGHVAAIRVRAHLRFSGPAEIGVIGAGDWELVVGGMRAEFNVHVGEGGFGESILAPPTRTTRFQLNGNDLLEAEVTLPPRIAGQHLSGIGLFGLIARRAPRDDAAVIADAVRAAAAADVAVVVVGLTEEQETESVDKHTLHLPRAQDELVRAVAAAAPRTVVVVNAATPVIMPWIDDVDAVLWAGLPGQEGGHAVAAALLGDIEPSGRLVTTFPVEDGATPAWSVTPIDGQLPYSEGRFIGYRGHFAARAPAPAFWFGHGLGYSTWEYTNAATIPDGVAVTVTNSGSRQSREVVQVYFRPDAADEPVRLVGWTSLTAQPGESVRVDVRTDARMWRRWDVAASAWTTLSGGGQLLIARGLGDVRCALSP
jgi:beta-glucosidase